MRRRSRAFVTAKTHKPDCRLQAVVADSEAKWESRNVSYTTVHCQEQQRKRAHCLLFTTTMVKHTFCEWKYYYEIYFYWQSTSTINDTNKSQRKINGMMTINIICVRLRSRAIFQTLSICPFTPSASSLIDYFFLRAPRYTAASRSRARYVEICFSHDSISLSVRVFVYAFQTSFVFCFHWRCLTLYMFSESLLPSEKNRTQRKAFLFEQL